MKTNVIAAVALLASISVFQAPVLAHNEGRAQLQLTVVDATNAPVSNAIVTVFTMHGPRIANTDAKGVAVFADLPTAVQTQWSAQVGDVSNGQATRLKSGENKQTVKLHTESGS